MNTTNVYKSIIVGLVAVICGLSALVIVLQMTPSYDTVKSPQQRFMRIEYNDGVEVVIDNLLDEEYILIDDRAPVKTRYNGAQD